MAHASSNDSHGDGLARAIKWAIIVFAVALACLFFLLARDYRSLRRDRAISARELWLNAVVRNHGNLSADNATEVRSWMTFDYINKLFGLPSDYLKTKLVIADGHYPQLPLSGYAESRQVSSSAVVQDVTNAIREFFATSTPVASSSTGI